MSLEKNYFAWFGLPNQFFLNEVHLKKKFFALSRELHPDFHTQADEATRDSMLEKSVQNTQAYKTLSVFDSRVKYILELENVLNEENKNTLPSDFLMEMMDLNEEVDDAQFSKDDGRVHSLKNKLEQLKSEFLDEAKPAMHAYDADNSKISALDSVRLYYLKKRYLLRLEDNLKGVSPDM